jgi:hypothetical protein
MTDLEPGTVLAWTSAGGTVLLFRVCSIVDDGDTRSPVLELLAWNRDVVPTVDVIEHLPAALTEFGRPYKGWLPNQPWLFHLLRYKRRDPDWNDLGFEICGRISPRAGDGGHGRPENATGLFWQNFPQFFHRHLLPEPGGRGLQL